MQNKSCRILRMIFRACMILAAFAVAMSGFGLWPAGTIGTAFALPQDVTGTASSADPELIMEVEGGYDGAYRVTSWVPFRITVQNIGQDFKGEIEIIPRGSVREYLTAYVAPIELASNSKKEINMSAYISTIRQNVTIRLVRDGKSVLEKQVQFSRQYSPQTLLAAVLSDHDRPLKYLGGMRLFETNSSGTELVYLSVKSFPEDPKVMDAFNVLIIDNFDVSSLNEKQINVLTKWVEDGGLLVLGLGPNHRKVLTGLPDKLKSVEVTGEVILEDGTALEEYADKEFLGNEKLSFAKLNVKRGRTIVSSGGNPVIVNEKIGEGAVITLAFAPSLQPIADWAGNQTLWKNMLNINADTFVSRLVEQQYYGVSSVKYGLNYYSAWYMPDDEIPSVWWILSILAVYILLVGPVSYIILKKRDKRDLMWFTVPVIAVLTTVMIYIIGFGTRYVGPIVSSSTVVHVSDDLDAYAVSSLTVTTPHKGRLKLSFDRDVEVSSATEYYGEIYSSKVEPDLPVGMRVITSDDKAIEYLNLQTWDTRYLTTYREVNIPGGVIEDIIINDKQILIKVNNKSGFAIKDAGLCIGGNYIDIGDIEIGQQKDITVDIDSTYRIDYYDYLNNKFGQIGAVSSSGRKITREEQQKFMARQLFENVNVERLINTERQEIAVFFGWNNDDLPNGKVLWGGKEASLYNRNVFVMEVPYRFADTSEIRVFPGLVRARLISGGDPLLNLKMGMGLNQSATILRTNGDAVFQFQLPDYIKPTKIQILWNTNFNPSYGVKYPSQSSNTGRIYIQNIKTGEWEEIHDLITIDRDLDRYVSEGGILQLKAEVQINNNDIPEAWVSFPDIDITGVAK